MSSSPYSQLNDTVDLSSAKPFLTGAELLGWGTIRTALGQMVVAATLIALIFGTLAFSSLLGQRVSFFGIQTEWPEDLGNAFASRNWAMEALSKALGIGIIVGGGLFFASACIGWSAPGRFGVQAGLLPL